MPTANLHRRDQSTAMACASSTFVPTEHLAARSLRVGHSPPADPRPEETLHLPPRELCSACKAPLFQ